MLDAPSGRTGGTSDDGDRWHCGDCGASGCFAGSCGRFARRLGQPVPSARRQLSEELQAARGALEKEAQLLDQTRREKEELLYRVLNAGDGAPFPMAAGEVPLIAT